MLELDDFFDLRVSVVRMSLSCTVFDFMPGRLVFLVAVGVVFLTNSCELELVVAIFAVTWDLFTSEVAVTPKFLVIVDAAPGIRYRQLKLQRLRCCAPGEGTGVHLVAGVQFR